jgi:prolyl oligopeptidase
VRYAGLLALGISLTALASPPATERRDFAYTQHGRELKDPYRWLEGSAAPELAAPDPGLDAAVSAWTDAQNAYTRATLDALPGRTSLAAELTELLSLDSWGTPQSGGPWLFYTLRRGAAAQPVLYAQRGRDGEPRVLVDVNSRDAAGLLALDWYRPSLDGRYVAFGTSHAGDENSTLHVLNTATGEWLADEIEGRVDPVEWLADHEHFVVRRLADSDDPYSGQILLHRLGAAPGAAAVLFEQYTQGALATTWGPYPIVDESGRWLVVVYYTGTDANDVWFYDLDEWRATGSLTRRDLLVGEDALTSGFIRNGTFYALTTYGASNKRVLAFDLAAEQPERYREIIPARADSVIVGIAPARERIVVDYLADAYSRMEVFDLAGRPQGPLELPGIGSASIVTHPAETAAWLRFETFGEPPAIYSVDLQTRGTALWRRPQLSSSAADVSLTVRQVRYRSRDGTAIPLFLVHRADLVLDGDNPTVLYGYGGFDISMTPSFLTAWRPWLTRGGVYAIANLRGGGEFGADWHRAGMLESKQNVFDDFYAAAEWLIEQGYTRPERLGISGRSNGGLLTGVAITQRPELFGAAIVGVPLLDMLRYQHFLMARYWVPEYGSAEAAEQFEFLLQYSPYQNVRVGTAYPATLLTAGENDSRVHPLHARKMAAALQAATSAAPAQEPILLWVDRATGHGQGKPLAARIRDAADEVVFMAWQLGLDLDL